MRFFSRLFLFLKSASPIVTQEDVLSRFDRLTWQASGRFRIAEVADVPLPDNTRALNPVDASTLLEIYGNLPQKDTYLVSSDDLRWFTTFIFNPSGYVRDNEKIDADKLLAMLKSANANENIQRRQRDVDVLYLEDWHLAPRYDAVARRLEWALTLRSESRGVVVNHTARILGRYGILSATLVSRPETLEQDVEKFHSLLGDLSFLEGHRYEEFRPGDTVAEYGLSTLIIGKGTATAAKSDAGFFGELVKYARDYLSATRSRYRS